MFWPQHTCNNTATLFFRITCINFKGQRKRKKKNVDIIFPLRTVVVVCDRFGLFLCLWLWGCVSVCLCLGSVCLFVFVWLPFFLSIYVFPIQVWKYQSMTMRVCMLLCIRIRMRQRCRSIMSRQMRWVQIFATSNKISDSCGLNFW